MKIVMGGVEFDVQEMGREGSLSLLIAKLAMETRADNAFAQAFVKQVARVCEETSPSYVAMSQLRRACGYIENGTSGAVTIGQDDATKDWIVRDGSHQYYGSSIEDALSKVKVDDDQA